MRIHSFGYRFFLQKNKSKRHIAFTSLFLLLFLLSGQQVAAQGINLGIPPIRNFSKKIYQAGTQNWAIKQDKQGRIYIANNEGLLSFDGTTWSLLPVKNNTIVRSVLPTEDGRIYVGAQSEFGYFEADADGKLCYHSLSSFVPAAAQNFADIWDIVSWDDALFFRWDGAIFEYRADSIKVHPSEQRIHGLFATSQGLFFQKEDSDLCKWDGAAFSDFLHENTLQSSISACIEWQADTLLFCSLKNGIYYLDGKQLHPWKTSNNSLLKENRISAAQRLHNGHLAISTALYGLLIFDEKKRIVQHLDRSNGLQNNNILSLYEDTRGTLWLGLDNGVDCIDLASPFTTIYPDHALEGTGYAAQVFDRRFYLGVSNGVYATDWKNYYNPKDAPFFKKVIGSDGQVWQLQAEQEQLWLGHHEGAFTLNGIRTAQRSQRNGFWKFVPLSADYMMAGTYNGLLLFEKKDGVWQEAHQFDELQESCRIMVQDGAGALWVAHPYRGLYRVHWSPNTPKKIEVKFYDAQHGLPSNLNNYVFEIAKKAVFGTENGVFRYNATSDAFERDTIFSNTIGAQKRVSCLQEDTEGNIWFVADKEVGFIKVEDFGLKKQFSVRYFPELTNRLVGGFEMIYPLDASNVFFGAERGFIHYNAAIAKADAPAMEVLISAVHLQGSKDSLLYGGYAAAATRRLAAHQNTLVFRFSSTDFRDPNLLRYRTRLLGLEATWSEWTTANARSYGNLPAGNYTFEVEAKRLNTDVSDTAQFEFKIAPPWYATVFARVVFVLGVLASWFTFWYWQRKNYESEKAQLTELHKQKEAETRSKVEQTKAALVEAQNEKLQTEIEARNKELALSTMHLVQKGQMIATIRERLHNIADVSDNMTVKKEVQQLLNLLSYDESRDEDWAHFARHFDRVHVDFLKRLRTKYPQISSNDQKLSAYLRMNLSTKEIATMMNISVRGVEASRYRLRKRLALEKEVNLNEFIMGV